MGTILQDTSAAALIAAIEENLFAIIPGFRRWPRAQVHEESDVTWSITDIPFPLYNSVFRAQLAADRVDVTIEFIIACARERNVPLLWWTGPATRPQDLGKRLEEHGFTNEGQEPGMAAELTKLNEDVTAPSGLTVERVGSAEGLRLWSQTCAAGFGMPDFVAEAMHDFMGYAEEETTLAYLGWLDGKPVATSLLVLAAGVAGIYNVATIPEARRQGIGTLVTLLPLREARTRGYRMGVLQASEMGVGVYRSLGFQEYCKIGHYVWLSERAEQGVGEQVANLL
jgi:ribosomal protein S18 acetylase RimI-like enzyme